MQDIEKIKRRLRNLGQNKDLTEDEIEKLAKEQIEKNDICHQLTFCSNVSEKDFAKDLLDRYLKNSSFENEADKDTLKHLIDLEILSERIKQFLKKEYEKSNPVIPLQMIEEVRELNSQILELKTTLGLTSAKKEGINWLDTWETLKKKALKYYEEHAGETYLRCPECNKLFRVLMRVTDKDTAKATFFKGTTLYNRALFDIYHAKRITKEEMTKIFGVSDFYIDFIYNNLYLKELENDRKD